MKRQPKKTRLIQARVPHCDYQLWQSVCDTQQMTISEGLRAAMATYAEQVERDLSDR